MPCGVTDLIFHAAALKQVPSCEFFPLDAIRTNAIGADNVMNAALACQVKNMILLSTDKAVYPINAMGMSKALMEKLMIAKAAGLWGFRNNLLQHPLRQCHGIPGFRHSPFHQPDPCG